MTFPSIVNRGEFFSNHYLDSVIASDLDELRRRWDDHEKGDVPSARRRIRSMSREFFATRGAAAEAVGTNQADTAVQALNDVVLAALGFPPDRSTPLELTRAGDEVTVPNAGVVDGSTGRLLVAVDAGFATDVDQLFGEADKPDTPLLVGSVTDAATKRAHRSAPEAIGQIFSTDESPRYVLVVAGTIVLLAERARWAEGRFLAVDIDSALERNDSKAKGELETIATLFSADTLLPGDGQSVLDDLVEKSHKHAVGVSKELRSGLRESIEILANEVVQQRYARSQERHDRRLSSADAKDLTRQCLRYLYRLLVLLYAESRPELGILPANDDAYIAGYSLDRLRELVLVDLDSDHARTGSHLDESLTLLFELVNNGYHAEAAERQFTFDADDRTRSTEEYLEFPGLDADLFEPDSTKTLNEVTLRNEALQQVLKKLMWAPGKGRTGSAGFISYAQLGINQLGAVYEGLMAYSGFFADEDLHEVAKNGDPEDGTWMLPVTDADECPDDVFVTRIDPTTGAEERVLHEKGSFVYRLSGRDRQRSASYYTPEVLTRSVVKHALAELLGMDDYAPEHGSSGITSAVDILGLTICEPALGSGAFANEAINQLAAVYLGRRQAELGESLDPERYRFELQKVKAHFALHQTYGVDLNATALELAEVSLWLNSMYPGLKAPWFGLQLRRGNSLIGCRRATWTVDQLGDKPWKETRKDKVAPPKDRPLDTPLGSNEIHHFLLPGHGWAAVADRKEAKELRETEAKALKEWRATVLKAPSGNDTKRLTQLAAAIEELWKLGTARIEATQRQLRRPIDIYGAEFGTERATTSRDDAYGAILNPDTPLGRLRTVMDAWVGLWFWPLDTAVTPPPWNQWLQVVEELVRPDETHGLTGQLDIFADYQAMLDADTAHSDGHHTLEDLRHTHPWLAVALDAAEREGTWHWDLEFAPVFTNGGFDLQVGNPPWVRLDWKDDLVLAEHDPWWGITDKAPAAVRKQRRLDNLTSPTVQAGYLTELASAEGVVEYLGSPVLRNVLMGTRTNLYMVFMDTVWRHNNPNGIAALLHPESHFTDPNAAALRNRTYGHLARHFIFYNEKILFEDVHHMTAFGINVYRPRSQVKFLQAASLMVPDTIDRSLEHNGAGLAPGIQYPEGGWDLRPHRDRVLTITEDVLADWAKLFDEPGTPPSEARLLRPVTVADLKALSVLAAQPVRLADHDYHWTWGWDETKAKTDGIIRWETTVPDSWDEVILQGPHFTIATPFNKQPNENCKHSQDYSEWDLENLPEHVIPRTNYQRATDRDTYDAALGHWDETSSSGHWRLIGRARTQPGLVRSLHVSVLQPGPAHLGGAFSLALDGPAATVLAAGLWSSLPVDYMVKVSGVAGVKKFLVSRFPMPSESPLDTPLLHRFSRLSCLTADYAPLWDELFDPSWNQDRWTVPGFDRLALGDAGPQWSMATPLRRDFERRLALVELDALAALMLGLAAEQLCAMYRTQFAVLRKYEHKMVFDAEGRKICGYHQSAGYRQSQLQDQAKAGDLPDEWKNLWKLYEQYEEDPDSVDWMGLYSAPFTRADRESEMTRAYNEFQRRLVAGEYGD